MDSMVQEVQMSERLVVTGPGREGYRAEYEYYMDVMESERLTKNG